jgi:uncharacterized membrane protein YeaQ/YmgE (transglycosylase-associated protein family)
MQSFIWMFLGAVIGWGTGRALQDGGYDWFRDVVKGIGGAVVGGLLGISDGLGGYRGTIVTTMMAIISATLLTVLIGFTNGRRSYAWSVQNRGLEKVNAGRSKAFNLTPDVIASKWRFAWSFR